MEKVMSSPEHKYSIPIPMNLSASMKGGLMSGLLKLTLPHYDYPTTGIMTY